MLMVESGDVAQLLELAATSVRSLVPGRMDGVYLSDEAEWCLPAGECSSDQGRRQVESQFAGLGAGGGQITVSADAWAWAYPLRSLEGPFGYLVAGADVAPSLAEQFLLRVLAQQMGIALANTRAHTRERATAAELRGANAVLAHTVATLEQNTAIHDRLTRVAMTGEGQEGIARALHELTGYPVAVEDRYGNLRAWAGPDRPEPYPKDDTPGREQLLGRLADEGPSLRDGGRLLALARPAIDVLGVLVLMDPLGTAGEVAHVALEHGAVVLAVELARLQSMAETELRVGRDLVEELLSGMDEERAQERAQALGYDLGRPHRVAVVRCQPTEKSTDVLFHAVRRVSRDVGIGELLVSRGRSVVVLAHTDPDWEQFRLAVAGELGRTMCQVGVGGSCSRPADFPRSYREAVLAMKVQDIAGKSEQATVFDDLGVYRILANVEDTSGIDRFIRQWLGNLLDYDARRGGELVLTLCRYLDSGRHHETAARALNVHRSTLKYRLRRIREVSGHDLGVPETAFNLELATRSWQTMQALSLSD
jgi:sugar diacid utilization regulator